MSYCIGCVCVLLKHVIIFQRVGPSFCDAIYSVVYFLTRVRHGYASAQRGKSSEYTAAVHINRHSAAESYTKFKNKNQKYLLVSRIPESAPAVKVYAYSTVTDLARFRGLSTSQPRATAV